MSAVRPPPRAATFILALVLMSAPSLPGQAPHAGSVAFGVGFGFNTAGSLGIDASVRFMATDRLALGCRVTTGWGVTRACGANVYVSPHRDWHLVLEAGHSAPGRSVVDGKAVSSEALFLNAGAGIEDGIKDDQAGEYRNARVHFVIGPSLVFAERTSPLGETVPWNRGLSPRFFNHTEVLLYPLLR